MLRPLLACMTVVAVPDELEPVIVISAAVMVMAESAAATAAAIDSVPVPSPSSSAFKVIVLSDERAPLIVMPVLALRVTAPVMSTGWPMVIVVPAINVNPDVPDETVTAEVTDIVVSDVMLTSPDASRV